MPNVAQVRVEQIEDEANVPINIQDCRFQVGKQRRDFCRPGLMLLACAPRTTKQAAIWVLQDGADTAILRKHAGPAAFHV